MKKELPRISRHIKIKRRELKITQSDLAQKAGVGLHFVRDLEQGKPGMNLGKVNQVLALFGEELVPAKIPQGAK